MGNGNAQVFALLPASKTTFPGEAGRLEELQAISFTHRLLDPVLEEEEKLKRNVY